jgi:hypothetical protein
MATSDAVCLDCFPGKFCPSLGSVYATSADNTNLCNAGFICAGGATRAYGFVAPVTQCPTGQYCP